MSNLIEKFNALRTRKASDNANVSKIVALIEQAKKEGKPGIEITAKDLDVKVFAVQTVYNACDKTGNYVETERVKKNGEFAKKYPTGFEKTGKQGNGEVVSTVIMFDLSLIK